ncbi:MAG: putative rane protein [Herbinix sp.]|nr:putative rane protein [Herbinix sp.]
MIKKNDIILIGVVLLLGLAFIIFINLTKEEGSKVVITVEGEVYDTLYLKENTTYTLELKDGTYNTFEIKDGYVDMSDASCPDKICVNHKSIHYNNETIVCLPNKVVLEVMGSENSGVDAIAN